MPKLSFVAMLMVATLSAPSQTAPTTPSTDSAWLRVQQLKPGSGLHIKTTSHTSIRCSFRSASEEALTCAKGKDLVVQRTEIQSIGVSHRGRSTLIGAAVGGGIGAGAGGALGTSGAIVGKGGLAAIFGIPLAIVGALIGAATDFSHSTVYRAP